MLKHPGHLRVHLKHKFPSFEGSSQMPTHWSDPHISSAYISGKGNQGGSVAISTEWNWLKQHNKKKNTTEMYNSIRGLGINKVSFFTSGSHSVFNQ